MRIKLVESVVRCENASTGALLSLEQRSCRASFVATLTVMVPASLMLLAPFAVLANSATGQPDVLADVLGELSSRPIASIQLGLALLVALAGLGYSVQRLLHGFGRKCLVTLERDIVRVVQKGPLGTCTWTAPLKSFRGIAHHARTTLSGVRHELVLVHADPRKCLLLEIASRIEPQRMAELCRLTGLGEVPARELYSPRSTPAGSLATDPLPAQA